MMDLVILNVLVLLPFNGLIERIIPSLGIGALAPTLSLLLLLYGLSIVIFLYFVLFEYYLLQTPGKMLFGLFVVNAAKKETEHGRITLEQAVVRNLQTMPIIPFLFLWFVDPVFVFLS